MESNDLPPPLTPPPTPVFEEPPSPPPPPEPISEQPEFHGTGSEYFGIWIVNVLLTLVTLGIYLPWARVRTRRYFYENTRLFDAPCEYLADPVRILVGYLIVGGMYLLYNVSGAFLPVLAIILTFVFIAVFPWLIFKAHRFFAVNSAYRNVPFRFNGTLGEAYAAYLGYPMLVSLTLGLMWPFVLFKQKEFFFNNFQYGHLNSFFRGRSGYFYKVYLGGFAILVGSIFLFGAGIAAIGAVTRGFVSSAGNIEYAQVAGLLGVFIFYGVFILFILVAKAFIQNHCWNHTTLENQVYFSSNLHPARYAWIQVSNVVATAFTLGFYAPWAKVRLHRYMCACLIVTVEAETDLDTLSGKAYENVSALGDSATEFLDIDFGF